MKITISQEGSPDIITFDIPDNPHVKSTEGLYLGFPRAKTSLLDLPKSINEVINHPAIKAVVPEVKDYCAKKKIKILTEQEAKSYISNDKMKWGSGLKNLRILQDKWSNINGLDIRFIHEWHEEMIFVGNMYIFYTIKAFHAMVYLSDEKSAKKEKAFCKDIYYKYSKTQK